MSATIQNTRLRVPVRSTVAALLRRVWPSNTAKHAANAARLSVRTAEAWVTERCTPSADTLLRMARENHALRVELARIIMETTDESLEDLGRVDAGAFRDASDQVLEPGPRVCGSGGR